MGAKLVRHVEGVPYYQYIAEANGSNIPYLTMNPTYITVHNTANTSRGADAEMHNRFVRNGGGTAKVSFHYDVDDHSIYQNLSLNRVGWHAGDGGNGTGNRKSIAIEICENSDGDFGKAVENAQALIRWLMDRYNIPISRVVPHQHWSGKYCPHKLLPVWDSFIEGVKNGKVSGVKTQGKKTDPNDNILEPGENGAKVKKLQESLIQAGYELPKYGADGDYGEETEEAVKAFQKENGLSVDGIVGPKTQAKINEKLEEDEMLKEAIVINSSADFSAAEGLANRKKAPIYTAYVAKKEQVAKHVYVVGGDTKGIKADEVTDLSGKDRYETAANVKKAL